MFVLVIVNGRLVAIEPIAGEMDHFEVADDYRRWYPNDEVRTNWIVDESSFPLFINS